MDGWLCDFPSRLAYCTDLAPVDVHLFTSIEHFFSGRIFRSKYDVDKNHSKNSGGNRFKQGIETLPSWPTAIAEKSVDQYY